MSASMNVFPSGDLVGDHVRNPEGEDLGRIEELMIDPASGRIAYAVLSFGGVLGIGDKLFAVPWDALRLDPDDNEFVLEVKRETLQNAPGFDKEDWPAMTDRSWGEQIHQHYGFVPYWQENPPSERTVIEEGIRGNDQIEIE